MKFYQPQFYIQIQGPLIELDVILIGAPIPKLLTTGRAFPDCSSVHIFVGMIQPGLKVPKMIHVR